MNSNRVSALAAFLALAACTASAEESSLPPKQNTPQQTVLLESLQSVHKHRVWFTPHSSRQHSPGLTLPTAASVQCAAFATFCGKDTKACITRSNADGPWESLIIDLNRNRDLTDDTAYPLPVDTDTSDLIIDHNDAKHAFVLQTRRSGQFIGVELTPNACWSGSTALGNSNILWAACDCNLSSALDNGDTALIDLNGNGKLFDRGEDEHIPVGPEAPLYHQQAWYTVMAAVEGNGIAISPYAAPMMTLTVDHSGIATPADARHDLKLYLPNRRRINVKNIQAPSGVALPAARFRAINGTIQSEPLVTYYIRNVDMSRDAAIRLEAPKSQLSVRQHGQKITVNQRMVTSNSVSYRLARSKAGPLVEVFSEKDPAKPITQGNMAYG